MPNNFLSSIPPVARNATVSILATIAVVAGVSFTIQGPKTGVAPAGDIIFRLVTGSGAQRGYCDDTGACSFSGAITAGGLTLSAGSTITASVISGALITASGANVNHVPFVIGLVSSGSAIATGSSLPTLTLPFDGRVAWMHCAVDRISNDTGNLNATIDARFGATSIFTTKVTIDGNEKDSQTAATPPVINTAANGFTQGFNLNFNFDQVGGSTPAQGANCRGVIVKEAVSATQP